MTDTAADPVRDFIAQTIADHPVVLFMKGTPGFPQCGFSGAVVGVLDEPGRDLDGFGIVSSNRYANALGTSGGIPHHGEAHSAERADQAHTRQIPGGRDSRPSLDGVIRHGAVTVCPRVSAVDHNLPLHLRGVVTAYLRQRPVWHSDQDYLSE